MRIVFLLSSIFLASCAHTSHQGDFITRADSDKIIGALTTKLAERQALSGYGSVSIVTPQKNGAAQAVLQLEWPNNFRLELQDPLARSLFLLQFDPGYLWVDDAKKKEAILVDLRSAVGLARARDLFGLVDLGADHFQIWMQMFLARPSLQGFLVDQADPLLLRKFKGGIVVEEIRLSARWQDLAEWRIFRGTDPNDEALHISYEEYESRSGLQVPRLMRLEVDRGPRKGSRMVWRWQDWQPNPGRRELLSLPPHSTDRVIKKLP